MTLKVLFRYHDKPPISRLFQIATNILMATVLKPIGESLRIITDGGIFVIVEDNNSSSDSLSITFSNVSNLPACTFLFYS